MGLYRTCWRSELLQWPIEAVLASDTATIAVVTTMGSSISENTTTAC